MLTFGYSGTAPASRPASWISVTYPTAPQTSLSYDYYPNGLLKDVIDQDGNRFVSYVYDGQNRATQIYMGGNEGIGS